MERVCFQLHVRAGADGRVPRASPRRLAGDARRRCAPPAGRNYSLFLRPDGLLIGYVETEDFEAATAAMDATDVNARWQAEMAPFFSQELSFERLEEVFHLD